MRRHLELGDEVKARLVAAMDPEVFSEADKHMRGAFVLGLATGLPLGV